MLYIFFKNVFFYGHKLDMSFFKNNNIVFFFGRILYIFSLINKVGFFLIEIFYLIKNLFFLTAWQGINLGQIRDDLLLHAFESITLKIWVRQISILGFKGERVYKRRNQRWSRDIPQNPHSSHVLYGKVLKPDDTDFYREYDDKAKARV